VTASNMLRMVARAIGAGVYLLFWSLAASGGLAAAQQVSPDPKPDMVAPAPAPANGPPDKISPPVLSPKNESPDTKAENRAPDLKLDQGDHKLLPDSDPTHR
jgi:hypothetical protein